MHTLAHACTRTFVRDHTHTHTHTQRTPPPPPPRDLPQGLQDSSGGFLAEGAAFQDAFVYYADTLFRELGPLVKLWMT
jgi:hypothetical protein